MKKRPGLPRTSSTSALQAIEQRVFREVRLGPMLLKNYFGGWAAQV